MRRIWVRWVIAGIVGVALAIGAVQPRPRVSINGDPTPTLPDRGNPGGGGGGHG